MGLGKGYIFSDRDDTIDKEVTSRLTAQNHPRAPDIGQGLERSGGAGYRDDGEAV